MSPFSKAVRARSISSSAHCKYLGFVPFAFDAIVRMQQAIANFYQVRVYLRLQGLEIKRRTIKLSNIIIFGNKNYILHKKID
jgi:hypothetical protein